jgi:hypothetical protein
VHDKGRAGAFLECFIWVIMFFRDMPASDGTPKPSTALLLVQWQLAQMAALALVGSATEALWAATTAGKLAAIARAAVPGEKHKDLLRSSKSRVNT